MKPVIHLSLTTTPEQLERLRALQAAFAGLCNALAPLVQQNRCWNRVALHHLAYRALREQFPQMGSQMVCNAIYSVSRSGRLVFQHPDSPWNVARRPDARLPLLRFLPSSPVYFDRHTLSIKDGQLSMYTLDGRMRFQLDLSSEDEALFHQSRLKEIVLSGDAQGYRLSFWLADAEDAGAQKPAAADLPEYLLVLPDPASLAAAGEQEVHAC